MNQPLSTTGKQILLRVTAKRTVPGVYRFLQENCAEFVQWRNTVQLAVS